MIRVDPTSGAQTTVSSGGSFFEPVGIAIAPTGVGGIADLPAAARTPLAGEGGSSGPGAAALAGIGAAGSVALGGAAWYARRRRNAP